MFQQFLLVAAVHFLALLSPGPDFFLVARTAIKAGWRHAAHVCLGIAAANGVFIIAAFSGIALLQPDSLSFSVIQMAGCAWLIYIGQLFIRFAGSASLTPQPVAINPRESLAAAVSGPLREFGMGFLSGVLNPKNALFYVSLATLLGGAHATAGLKIFYGLWMFSIVLVWDLLVAIFIGNGAVLRAFSQFLPWLERISGIILIGLALSVIAVNLCR